MNRFRVSELFFLGIGLSLTVISLYYYSHDYSIAHYFRHISSDPFQASYSVATKDLTEDPTPAIQLLSPASDEILEKIGNEKEGYHVRFKFEMNPRTASSELEILYRGKPIYVKLVPANQSGIHEVTVTLKKPGIYEWRAKDADITTDFRNITILESNKIR